MLSDVEISRALNALGSTLREQRPQRFEQERAEEIMSGALGGEDKLRARAIGERSGEVLRRGDDRLVALVEVKDGRWSVERRLLAGESTWALPEPAHREYERERASGMGEAARGRRG